MILSSDIKGKYKHKVLGVLAIISLVLMFIGGAPASTSGGIKIIEVIETIATIVTIEGIEAIGLFL